MNGLFCMWLDCRILVALLDCVRRRKKERNKMVEILAKMKEAINDEMDSIMGNNTWVLADLPPGCKPLGCKWIFKRKLKVDGTIEKLKARLVIQGFKQKSGIYYFDTYAHMAHISTIRLLIALASIHSLIIHQMDVKTTFLNGDLDEEVDLTKDFLSSRFSMKDMGEADVILGIRIKHESNGVAISQSHYIKKVLKKFNYFDCTPVITPMDTSILVTWYSTVLEGYTDASWISNTKDNSSTSSWVKPMAPISILSDSAATLAKAYSQMYNRKSRHLVAETFHEQTDDELTKKEVKQMEADDQAIQTILMGLSEDIYATKKANLFNEWERFASTDEESIESYYHRFSKLMNDFKRNKHFPEKIASNLKFLNNLQPEWKRHVTIVHQTKDLNTIAQPGMNMGQDRQIQMVKGTGGNQFRQYAGQNVRNQNGYNAVQCVRNQNGNGNVIVARVKGNTNGNNGDLNEIEEVNANYILMANLQQASTSGTQTDMAPVYDSDGSAEVHNYDNCYNNEIFNMFTQEEQYTELLEPISEPHQVQQNDSNVISDVPTVEQNRGTVEQSPATVEETRALYDSLYNKLAIEVENVNSVNRKMKATNAELTTELARYKNQEKFFEINQEKYEKLERYYQKSFYQEQCLTKKVNALHLSSAKMITTLNEEIENLNNMLSKEKSTVSSLQEENKRMKTNFKIHEDKVLDKQILLEKKIKELDNILVKTEKHDPPAVYDSEETLQLAQESRLKMKQLNKEIKPANYTKINHLSGVFVSQMAKSREESYFTNTSKTATVSKSISIPNEEFSDDTTPSVARKFLNEKTLELKIERLLRAVVSHEIMSIVQSNSVEDTSNLQTELEPHNDMKQKIEWLQAQLGDLKGKSKDTSCASDTPDPVPQKVDKTNDLSKPVTSNSEPIINESKIMKNDNVIAPGMFRIDPRKTSREDKPMPINKVRASIRKIPITVSQPHVITKKDVNSDSNGLSST
ncbi:retrovirus-related pol polyprotein from transposon TNT 1-94 [Tanacetum coccineum]|uniref:Retrovirus-related pol polyprotein from transposon TNT 1-94 n=1 Tax=Tanacetum coccineum TaxID=301880 RepID=A0ABQ4WRL5_9ASTR